MDLQPGRIVLMGSGEASPSGRRVFDWLFQRLPSPLQIALLETPAGFQPNSELVAQRIVDFLYQRLSHHALNVAAVPARRRGTPFSPDDPALADQVLAADAMFMGPGSPTYAVRQLRDSIVWDAVRLRCAEGGTLVLASAAVLALGTYTLPVYEIYKVGADLEWTPGLDLLSSVGAPVAFVPHWSNREGGAELDTTHCFMGAERFGRLRALLPPETVIVGIDEHTSLILEPSEQRALVIGQGTVTIERGGRTVAHGNGDAFPLSELGDLSWEHLSAGAPPVLYERAHALAEARRQVAAPAPVIPAAALELVDRREEARRRRDWAAADALRAEIAALGVQVDDTPSGPRVQAAPRS